MPFSNGSGENDLIGENSPSSRLAHTASLSRVPAVRLANAAGPSGCGSRPRPTQSLVPGGANLGIRCIEPRKCGKMRQVLVE